MNKVAIKTISYLPEGEFRFKRKRSYIMATKKDILENDDFLLTMTLFEFDGVLTCWIGMDMGRCDKGFYEVLWKAMSNSTNLLTKEHFWVNGTHTHSGPTFTKYEEMGPESASWEGMGELAYDVAQQCVELFNELKGQLQPFRSEIKVTEIDGCYSNRNSLDAPCDKNAVIIKYIDETTDNLIGLWFSMNCHSTMMFPKNEYLSSDLVGNVAKNIASYYNAPVMPMCGAQGDTSTRLTRHRSIDEDNDVSELRRIVKEVTSQCLNEENQFEEIQINKFEVKNFSVSYSYNVDKHVLVTKIDALKKEIEQITDMELLRTKKTSQNALEKKLNGPTHVDKTISCNAINMGELKFAAMSGELVASLGLQIVEHAPGNHKMVVCYINDPGSGYLVERSEYGKNFESATSDVPVGIPEVLTDMAVSELKQFDLENESK